LTSSYAVIIPARYTSSRLPGKPLVDLLGVPMVVRTYRQVIKAVAPDLVYVATENPDIKAVCESFGIRVLMTTDQCLTGTDRIAECARQLPGVSTFINVQGDEPVFEPNDVKAVIEAALAYPEDVINGYCAIDHSHHFVSGTIPKVVFRPDGRLLYMSRAAIPTTKTHQFKFAHRQVCCYAFPLRALEAFSGHGVKTELEEVEDIEILRFLELGYEVRMIPLSSRSIAVDVPEDIPEVEAAIRERGL
jgi:3-deoxy-manno-octulosonate cytidylyltransferase (CMP-KDO synthetase)